MHSLGTFAGDAGDVARKNGGSVLNSAAKPRDFNMLPEQGSSKGAPRELQILGRSSFRDMRETVKERS
jgi:hypothetical protein